MIYEQLLRIQILQTLWESKEFQTFSPTLTLYLWFEVAQLPCLKSTTQQNFKPLQGKGCTEMTLDTTVFYDE